MNSYFQKIIIEFGKNFNILLSFLLLFISGIYNSCTESTEPDRYKGGFSIQLETDIDNGILKYDGTLWTWGGNSTGQMGNGTMLPCLTPTENPYLSKLISFDFCDGGAVAVDVHGDFWYWGDRLLWGYSDVKPVIIPVKISHLENVKKVIVGGVDAYLLCNDGIVWKICINPRNPTGYSTPEKINELQNIEDISGVLALKKDGTIVSFPGYEDIEPSIGGIGNNIFSNVKSIQNRIRIYSLILKDDGTVWAWGRNSSGTLGNNTIIDNPIPGKIKNLDNIISISANGSRCLALKSDGTVWFWGLIYLKADSNIPISQNEPKQIENFNNVRLIHAGAANKCLFMKNDSSFWSFDVYSKILEKLVLN
jgi:alpha-tubulin suppressor-like RCC1 family protein